MTEHSRRKLLAATGTVIGSSTVLSKAAGADQSTGRKSPQVIDVQVSNEFQATPTGDWTLNHIEVCPPKPELQTQRDTVQDLGESVKGQTQSEDLILMPAIFYDEDNLIVTDVNQFNSVRHIVYLENTSPTPSLDISKPDSSTLSIGVDAQKTTESERITKEVTVPTQGKTEVPLYEREIAVRATQQTDERRELPNVPEWRRPYKTREKTVTLPVKTKAIVRPRKPETVQIHT